MNIVKQYLLLIILFICSCTKSELVSKQAKPLTNEQNVDAVTPAKPNILFILVDDVGYEVPTYTGGESYNTPNLDKLAAQGVQYQHCESAPNCSPSRTMLLLGKYNFRSYEWGVLDTNQHTFVNLLHDNGYKTCITGKWQLSGGDASIHKAGFDKYAVFDPFKTEEDEADNLYRYKNPHVFENNAFWPNSLTDGKYGDDLYADYICKFMEDNRQGPFLAYFSTSLCHTPFCPTPDDPEFAAWDPFTSQPNKKFYPSMVKYMDKKVGQVIDKVSSLGLSNNTVIIFVTDNGTAPVIKSKFKGELVKGGKNTPTIFGTHVPLIIKTPPAFNSPGAVRNTYVSFVDFLPTIAKGVGLRIPASYGVIDGISFYPSITKDGFRNARPNIYCYWKPFNGGQYDVWVNDSTYKLYNQTNNNNFYNIKVDPNELSPLPQSSLTQKEIATKSSFQSVLDSLNN